MVLLWLGSSILWHRLSISFRNLRRRFSSRVFLKPCTNSKLFVNPHFIFYHAHTDADPYSYTNSYADSDAKSFAFSHSAQQCEQEWAVWR
jgi:hypothetical protein